MYSLEPSVNAVKRSMTGVLTPATLSCKAWKTIGNEGRELVTGGVTICYRTSLMSNHAVYSAPLTLTAQVEWVDFELLDDNANPLDCQRVTVLSDASDLVVGGRNLLKESGVPITNSSYRIQDYLYGDIKPVKGKTYTISMKAMLGAGKLSFALYNSGITNEIYIFKSSDKGTDGVYRATFTWPLTDNSLNTFAQIYHKDSTTVATSTIEWIKLEEGNVATAWTPAPEDIQEDMDIAKSAIDAINDDSILDIAEKYRLRTTWELIHGADNLNPIGGTTNGSYLSLKAAAVAAAVSTASLDNSYGNLIAYLQDVYLYNNTNTSEFVRAYLVIYLMGYYAQETALLKAINEASSTRKVENLRTKTETNFQKTNEAIGFKVTQTVYDKNNEKINDKISEIVANVEGITSTVSNTKIGVRNYFLDSGKVHTKGGTNGETIGIKCELSQPWSSFSDKDIVLSFYYNYATVFGSGNRIGVEGYCSGLDGVTKFYGAFVSTNNPTMIGAEKRKVVTLHVEPNNSKSREIFVYFQTIGTASIQDIKVECGNKVTDWTPAPEDSNKLILEAKTVADNATKRLTEWADDGFISPTEKIALQTELANITAEHSQLVAEAGKYNVEYTAYVSSYSSYAGQLKNHSQSNPENIEILPLLASTQSAYYTARTNLIVAITTAQQEITGNLSTQYSQIQQKADSITSTVVGNQAIISGECLYPNESFAEDGVNGCVPYGYSGDTWDTVTITKIADISSPTGSDKVLRLDCYGSSRAGRGGYLQGIQSRANAIFVQRIVAKIPIGFNIIHANNDIGNSSKIEWLSDVVGTGEWKEYIVLIRCGLTGTFNDCGYIYLTGTNGTDRLAWYVASSSVWDATKTGYSLTNAQFKSEIKQLSNSISLKVKETTDNMKFSSRNYALKTSIKKVITGLTGATNQVFKLYDVLKEISGGNVYLSFDYELKGCTVAETSMISIQAGPEWNYDLGSGLYCNLVPTTGTSKGHVTAKGVLSVKPINGTIALRCDNILNGSIIISNLMYSKGANEVDYISAVEDAEYAAWNSLSSNLLDNWSQPIKINESSNWNGVKRLKNGFLVNGDTYTLVWNCNTKIGTTLEAKIGSQLIDNAGDPDFGSFDITRTKTFVVSANTLVSQLDKIVFYDTNCYGAVVNWVMLFKGDGVPTDTVNLIDTGIDIENRKIILTADTTLIQDNSGNQIALFENGKIKASVIDVNQITAKKLQTAENGKRIIIDDSNKLSMYDNSGNLKLIVSGDSLGGSMAGGTKSIGRGHLSCLISKQNGMRPDVATDEAIVCTFELLAANNIVTIPAMTIYVNVTNETPSGREANARYSIDLDNTQLGSVEARTKGIDAMNSQSIPQRSITLAKGLHTITARFSVRGFDAVSGSGSTSGSNIAWEYTQELIQIASDGFRADYGGNKFLEATANGIIMRHGNFGLKVSDNGVQKLTNGISWANL